MPHLSPQPWLVLMPSPLVHGASCRAPYLSPALLSSVGTDIEKAQSGNALSETLVPITNTTNKAMIIAACGSKRDFRLGSYL